MLTTRAFKEFKVLNFKSIANELLIIVNTYFISYPVNIYSYCNVYCHKFYLYDLKNIIKKYLCLLSKIYKIKNKITHHPDLQRRFREELEILPREVYPLFRNSHSRARFLCNIILFKYLFLIFLSKLLIITLISYSY